jgi:hypothetical protein
VATVWGVVLATGALVAVEIPPGQLYGGWTMQIEGMDRYMGRILAARIGSVEIAAAGPLADSSGAHSALRAREPLAVTWLVGTAPARLAPLVILIGPDEKEVALIAARESDLVVRYWRHAARFLLEQPELTFPDALAGLAPGSRAALVATRSATGVAVEIEGQAPARIGLGPGRGWALLAPDRWVAPALRPALDALWLAILLVPVGLWLPRGGRGLGLAALALAALWLVPARVGLEPAAFADWIGALAGLAGGRGWALLARRAAMLRAPQAAR